MKQSRSHDEFPVGVIVLDLLPLFDVTRIERAVHDQRATNRGARVQPNAIEVDYQSVTRHSTVNVKGRVERIACRGTPNALGSEPPASTDQVFTVSPAFR